MKGFNLAIAIIMISVLWLAAGCSQKTVQSGLTPSDPARDAASTTAGPDLKQPGTAARGIGSSSGALTPDGAGPLVESLDATSMKNASSSPYGQSQEGRCSASLLPVYFDFDRANIRDDQQSRMANNASFIKQQKQVKVRIEGNCDERGTREYNLALGERRAMAAKQYMVDLGIDEALIETLSYGEERPLVQGDGESVRTLNRRADFVLENLL